MVRSPVLLVFLSAALLAADGPPEFEVATVRTSPPPSGDLININPGTIRNGRVTFSNASLSDCLKLAFGIVSDDQISGPDWIKSKAVRFDIVAQAPANVSPEQFPVMLQALLADRLKLALHHENRNLSYLALMAGKGGPKMPLAIAGGPAAESHAMAGRISLKSASMQHLATFLSRFQRQTVMDLTGLTDSYNVELEWTPDESHPGPDASAVAAGPSIFTAVQEQLGLRLESRRGPVDVLVIDHAEKIPVDN